MTRSDVFLQILTEIANEHKEEVREILKTFQSTVPGLTNLNKFDKELSTEEAQQLLADFHQDKDNIRIWLLMGRNSFVSRARKTHGSN
jgi:hypothetical protein